MNKVILMGRLTRDVETRWSQGNEPMAISRYTLAVDRRGKKDGDEQTADFINCVAFGRAGEFAEKYFHKGDRIGVFGSIRTGSYEKDGKKITTFDIVVDEIEFLQDKKNPGVDNNPFLDLPEA